MEEFTGTNFLADGVYPSRWVHPTPSSTTNHHLSVQHVRVHLENTIADNWVPGALLYTQKVSIQVPDGTFYVFSNLLPDGSYYANAEKYSLEVALTVKSHTKMKSVLKTTAQCSEI